MIRKVKFERGSSNIFADLGLPHPETHLLKAEIMVEIVRLCEARNLTQHDAGRLMGITQPEVSRLFQGHFREYSVERLMNFLTAFGRDVEIVSRPHKGARKPGKITFKPVMA